MLCIILASIPNLFACKTLRISFLFWYKMEIVLKNIESESIKYASVLKKHETGIQNYLVRCISLAWTFARRVRTECLLKWYFNGLTM